MLPVSASYSCAKVTLLAAITLIVVPLCVSASPLSSSEPQGTLGGASTIHVQPSALLTIDQNRATVVKRIVSQWGDHLASSNAGITASQLQEILNGLRSDHLLAASLAGSVEGLRDVVSGALVHSDSAVSPALMQTKSLGDVSDDLVYTPVVPCRILDTRNGTVQPYTAPMVGGSAFPVTANLSNFGPQGGSATNCNLPSSFQAIAVTLTVLNPNFDAFLAASNSSNFASLIQAVVMDFSANKGLANTAIVPVDGTVKFYLALPAQVTTNVIADVAGYFKAPSGGFVTSVATGPGLTGGPITTTGTIGLATTQLLPTTACAGNQVPQWNGSAWICATAGTGTVTSVGTGSGLTGGPITTSGTLNLAATNLLPTVACSANQIPKWNGSAWTCGNDNNSGGTVTSITAGAGLTGGTITSSGTIAVDPTSPTLTSNFFKQGGNAFGVPAQLGTTDSNPLQVAVGGTAALFIQPDAISPLISAGYSGNSATPGASGATIGGGGALGPVTLGSTFWDCGPPGCGINRVTDAFGTVAGGLGNRAGNAFGTAADAPFATVSGGFANIASGTFSTVAGGTSGTALAEGATVGGGNGNAARGPYSTIAGGSGNDETGDHSTVGGGRGNQASGAFSTVPGGDHNVASGAHSFAAGTKAYTQTADSTPIAHDGAFVWADSNDFFFNSTANNEFSARATGGVRFVLGIDGAGAPTWTCAASNGNSWACSSDRNLKENFSRVDGVSVLQRLSELPLYFWNAKGTDPNVRHMGPTAQDFMAAFALGNSDKMIGMQDAEGIAFAAIQGLHQMMQQKDREIAQLRRKLQTIEAKLGM